MLSVKVYSLTLMSAKESKLGLEWRCIFQHSVLNYVLFPNIQPYPQMYSTDTNNAHIIIPQHYSDCCVTKTSTLNATIGNEPCKQFLFCCWVNFTFNGSFRNLQTPCQSQESHVLHCRLLSRITACKFLFAASDEKPAVDHKRQMQDILCDCA